MINPVNDSKTTIDLQKSEVTVTGPNPAMDATRSIKKTGERSFEWITTRGGVPRTSVFEVSANGKTLSVRNSVSDADGKLMSSTTIYDRQ